MSQKTGIEWTDKTWNPVVGCTKVSDGCKNCYAKTLHDQRHKAFKDGKKLPSQYAEPFEVIQLKPDRLGDPLSWRKPCRVFVNSVSDLFHEGMPDAFIRRVFGVMSMCGQHTFQILTKRPERMQAWFADPENSLCACQAEEVVYRDKSDPTHTPSGRSRIHDLSAINGAPHDRAADGNQWPLPNVWLGVSIENQAAAYERIPRLLQTPAAVRFLSCEPLLDEVILHKYFAQCECGHGHGFTACPNTGGVAQTCHLCDCRKLKPKLSWVIIGGESGPGARPCHVGWIRSLVAQCKAASVACFVKQLGAAPFVELRDASNPSYRGTMTLGYRDKKGGSIDEFPADLRVREFPHAHS